MFETVMMFLKKAGAREVTVVVRVLLTCGVAAAIRRWSRTSLADKSVPFWNRDAATDLFFGLMIFPVSVTALRELRAWVIASFVKPEGALGFLLRAHDRVHEMPLWLRIVLCVVATDFLEYAVHRLQHTRLFWRFHVVHHSARDVDWTTGFRRHPFDELVPFLPSIVAMVVIFDIPEWIAMLQGTVMLVAALLTHMNLRWTFGPLRYVFTSPVAHRWHHERDVTDVNFGTLLLVWDYLFGTAYQPVGEMPSAFGVKQEVPTSVVGLALYPLRREAGGEPRGLSREPSGIVLDGTEPTA